MRPPPHPPWQKEVSASAHNFKGVQGPGALNSLKGGVWILTTFSLRGPAGIMFIVRIFI